MEENKSDNQIGFTYDEIINLIDKVSASNIDEFKINTASVKIELKKNKHIAADSVSVPTQNIAQGLELSTVDNERKETVSQPAQDNANIYVVKSPIVGVFYASKEEGGEPLVKVGDSVKKDSIVAIIEAMKLMNEITAGADGVVAEILVENGELVEYGQELMKIEF